MFLHEFSIAQRCTSLTEPLSCLRTSPPFSAVPSQCAGMALAHRFRNNQSRHTEIKRVDTQMNAWGSASLGKTPMKMMIMIMINEHDYDDDYDYDYDYDDDDDYDYDDDDDDSVSSFSPFWSGKNDTTVSSQEAAKCRPCPKDQSVSPTKEKPPSTFPWMSLSSEVKGSLCLSTAWPLDGIGARGKHADGGTVCRKIRGLARLAALIRGSWPETHVRRLHVKRKKKGMSVKPQRLQAVTILASLRKRRCTPGVGGAEYSTRRRQ